MHAILHLPSYFAVLECELRCRTDCTKFASDNSRLYICAEVLARFDAHVTALKLPMWKHR